MIMRLSAVTLPVLLGLALAGPAAGVVPGHGELPALAPTGLPSLAFPLPDRAQLADQDKAAAEADQPYRFALPAEVALTPRSAGRWSSDGAGREVWRLRLVSPGALSLNLGFVTCDLPPSATLVLRPMAGGPSLSYRADDLVPAAELWTPVLLTDDLVVEVTVAAAERDRVALELARVNRGYRYFGQEPAHKAGTCNIDVVCPEGDDWRNEIRTVGVYTLGGSWKCTGALVNTTAGDGRALFLTANHCAVTAVSDASVVVYWNYQSPVCGEQAGGSLTDSQTGSTLRANWTVSDFCLLELDDQPLQAWSVAFAGWSRADSVPVAAVTIHHPSTDEKSISFENDPLLASSYLDLAPLNQTHLRITAWDLGTTEPGSSGAPLFDPDHRIVGQLHGGYASCSLPAESDWYGRLFTSWEGNGTAATRLRDWLDPEGSGALSVDLLDPSAGLLTVTPLEPIGFQGPVGGPFLPAQHVFTVTNSGTEALDWTVIAGAGWLAVAPAGGNLLPDAAQDVIVSLDASAADLGAGTRSTSLVFANSSGGHGGAEIPVALAVLDRQPKVVAVGPNPFRGYTTVVYTMGADVDVHARVYDLRGRMAADLGSQAAEIGRNEWTWDGTDGEGRRQPGGLYVLELDAAGYKVRVRLTLLH